MVAAVATIAAISCTQELDTNTPATPEVTGETVVFTAYADGADTKTTLITNGNTHVSEWTSGDRIWILNGKKGDEGWKKGYSTTDSGSKATFTEEDGSYALEGTQYFAIYPAEAANDATWTGGDVNGVTLKSNQTATAGSYDRAAHIAVAKSETTFLSFKNAVSLFKFTVKNEGVKSVTIYANTSGYLTGSCNISAEGNVTPWTGEGEANGWVELSAGNGTFTVGEAYYIAVFPNTEENNLKTGFTVQFSFDGTNKLPVKSYTKALTLNRKQILDLGELEYVVPKTVDKVYLKPNRWNVGNSTFFLHLYNPTGAYTQIKMADSDNDGTFEATIPTGYSKATLCRMPKNSSAIDWSKKENQIENIELPLSGSSKNYFVINDWESGAWTTKPATKTLYFKPGMWNVDNAKFVAYSWKDGGTNAFNEVKVIANGVFSCEIPTAHTKVIVLRKSNNGLNWDGEYNRTGDVTIQNGVKCLEITGWDNSCKWSATL